MINNDYPSFAEWQLMHGRMPWIIKHTIPSVIETMTLAFNALKDAVNSAHEFLENLGMFEDEDDVRN